VVALSIFKAPTQFHSEPDGLIGKYIDSFLVTPWNIALITCSRSIIVDFTPPVDIARLTKPFIQVTKRN
jgi:hypothetical protein